MGWSEPSSKDAKEIVTNHFGPNDYDTSDWCAAKKSVRGIQNHSIDITTRIYQYQWSFQRREKLICCLFVYLQRNWLIIMLITRSCKFLVWCQLARKLYGTSLLTNPSRHVPTFFDSCICQLNLALHRRQPRVSSATTDTAMGPWFVLS